LLGQFATLSSFSSEGGTDGSKSENFSRQASGLGGFSCLPLPLPYLVQNEQS
jgi:hypothetical protein